MKKNLFKSCFFAAFASLLFACNPDEQAVTELGNISKSSDAMVADKISFDAGASRVANFVTSVTSDGGAMIGISGIQREYVPNWSPANPGEYSAENRANLYNTDLDPVSVLDPTIPGGRRISDDGDLSVASQTKNALIINHNSRHDVPDDWAWGGVMYVDFSSMGTVTLKQLVFLDNEENGTYIKLFNAGNTQIGPNIMVANMGDASSQVVNLGNTPGVARMEVHLGTTSVTGSGAIDDIEFMREVPPTGCTRTQGYWKTHSAAGPAPYDATWKSIGPLEERTIFFLSEQTYLEVMNTPVQGNGYYTLAHQYIATKLNLESASAPTTVLNAFAEATALFETKTPAAVKADKALNNKAIQLAKILDDYNNGLTGPGHCE